MLALAQKQVEDKKAAVDGYGLGSLSTSDTIHAAIALTGAALLNAKHYYDYKHSANKDGRTNTAFTIGLIANNLYAFEVLINAWKKHMSKKDKKVQDLEKSEKTLRAVEELTTS